MGGIGSAVRRESGITESTTFDYDEGDSITEPESEEEEGNEEMDIELSTTSSRRSRASPNKSSVSKRGELSPGSSQKSTPANLTTGRGRRGSDRDSLDVDTPFGNDYMDVSVDSGSRRSSKRGGSGTSPFAAGASPVGPDTSAISSGRKSSQGRPSYGDDDVDDYGGYGDYDDDYGDVSALSSKSGGSSRRVSFGKDTKSKPTDSGSRRSSFGSPGNRSRASDSTPGSARSTRSGISTPGSDDFARGAQPLDDTYVESDEEEEKVIVGKGKRGAKKGKKATAMDDSAMVDTDGEDIDSSGFVDDSFAAKLAKRGNGKRGKLYVDDAFGTYEDADEDEDMDLDEDSDDDGGAVRRSRRATKGKKMAWWKGERAIYNKGNMVGLLTAIPTPANTKKKAGPRKVSKKDKKSVKKQLHDSDSDEAEADLSGGIHKRIKVEGPIVLPEDVDFLPRGESDEVSIWDDATDTSKTLKVVCYEETLQPPSSLPVTAKRPPGKDKVGSAAQSFNVPEIPKQMSGWISGFVELPPQAIKDAEGVGECAQVFFISECQDGALELGIADPKEPEWHDETAQRQLLNKGDTFFVPPGNIYRLENHSQSTACTIFWTIVKPIESSED